MRSSKNKDESIIDLLVDDDNTIIDTGFDLIATDEKATASIQKRSNVKKSVAKANPAPKKVEARFPIRLLLEDDSTKLRNLNMFSELPLASLTVENVRKRYVIRQQIASKYTQDVTVTLLPPVQGFDDTLSIGLPTINDTDIIKFCVSLLQRKRLDEKINLTDDMRTVSFSYRDYLDFTGAQPGGTGLNEFRAALMRLKGTVIEITSEWIDMIPEELQNQVNVYNSGQFSFIDDFQISSDALPSKAKTTSKTIVTLTLSRIIWRTFMNPKNLIIYNRYFFKLSAFKKTLYEKIVKSMGHKEFFRIRLIKLASRMGYIEGDLLDEMVDENTFDGSFNLEESIARRHELDVKVNANLKYFRRLLKEAIADDDLLEFKIAVEKGVKSGGREMVVFYRRDYKHRLSNITDARTDKRITKLEYALRKMDLWHWWNRELNHSDQMRLLLAKNARWLKRFKYDLEAIRLGDADEKKGWARGQRSRYELLSYVRDIEKGKYTQQSDLFETMDEKDLRDL